MDCWGLTRLIYRDCYDIELPDFGDGYLSATDAATVRKLIEDGSSDWVEVTRKTVREGDLVWIPPAHLGIMLDGRRYIHAMSEIGRVRQGRIGDLSTPSTFWRHRGRLDV